MADIESVKQEVSRRSTPKGSSSMDDGISIMYAILLAIAIILLALLVLHRRKVAKQRAEHYRPQPKFRRRNPTRAEVGEQPNPARHFNPNAE